MPDPKFLFIGGTGRCGTNLLKNILSQHPQAYALPFESRFTTDPDGVGATVNTLRYAWTPFVGELALKRNVALLHRLGRRTTMDRARKIVRNVCKTLGYDLRLGNYVDWELSEWFPGYWDALKTLEEELTMCHYLGRWVGTRSALYPRKPSPIPYEEERPVISAYARFITTLYGNVLKKNDATVYVDDNTFNMAYGDVLYALLPESYFVHMVRDPRDVVSSYLDQGWAPDSIDGAVAYYKSTIARSEAALKRVPDAQRQTIRLEDLENSWSKVISNLASRCGLEGNLMRKEGFSVRSDSCGRWKKDRRLECEPSISIRLSNEIERYGYKES